MKTQNQKHYDKFSKRIERWWSNVVDWAEGIDFDYIFLNTLLAFLIGFTIFAVIYVATHNPHEDKTDSISDTVAVMDTVETKSDTVVFDTVISDTRVVIKAIHPIKVVIK